MNTEKEFVRLIEDAVKETGVELTQTAAHVAAYMNERAIHLASISGQPGFDQALRAERNNVALRAGISVAHNADQADARMLGLFQGLLGMGAAALA